MKRCINGGIYLKFLIYYGIVILWVVSYDSGKCRNKKKKVKIVSKLICMRKVLKC